MVQMCSKQIQDGGRPPSWKIKKILISLQPIDRFWRDLARWCVSILIPRQKIKFYDFINPRWRRPPCWKFEKLQYLQWDDWLLWWIWLSPGFTLSWGQPKPHLGSLVRHPLSRDAYNSPQMSKLYAHQSSLYTDWHRPLRRPLYRASTSSYGRECKLLVSVARRLGDILLIESGG